MLGAASAAADGPVAPFAGRPVAEVIDEFRAAGIPFAYSTGLVGEDLVVVAEPVAEEPFELVNEILRPHGLTLRTIAGVHLVIRIDRSEATGDAGPAALKIPGVLFSDDRRVREPLRDFPGHCLVAVPA